MNNKLLEFLTKEINESKISHAFLVETNNCEKLLNDITSLLSSKGIISNQSIENNIAVNIIRPENNLIDKNKILELQKFVITKSIISDYKVYFIINAELMNLSAYNKLLKVLEEPSDNVIAFLLTENMNQIISTIQSRCKKFKISYEKIEKEQDEKLLNMLITIKKLTFTEIIKLKSEILAKEKIEIIDLLQDYRTFISCQFASGNDVNKLANSYKILDNIIELIKSNVNVELCLDKMIIELRR